MMPTPSGLNRATRLFVGAAVISVGAAWKTLELEFCTVARWKQGEIVEEKLFYDQVGFLKQIGVL
jgi:hypothetical protein